MKFGYLSGDSLTEKEVQRVLHSCKNRFSMYQGGPIELNNEQEVRAVCEKHSDYGTVYIILNKYENLLRERQALKSIEKKALSLKRF